MSFRTLCEVLIPQTFATNSEAYGSGQYTYGKHPVKLYNSNNVLICQEDRGADNSGKLPSGGVLYSSAIASSMSATITSPNTFYGNWGRIVISQIDQSGDLYNYYWTSYSRGTDGQWVSNWHNAYLDSYIPLRYKSIYDPCPYGYRIPSNGTYNQFTNTAWTRYSYVGGTVWKQSWFAGLGIRETKMLVISTGVGYTSSNISNIESMYMCWLWSGDARVTHNYAYPKSNGYVIRCIEECELLPDATEAR